MRLLLFLVLTLGVVSPISALDDPKVAHAKYDELAAKVRGGDLNVDWQALRLAAMVGDVAGDYDLFDAAKRALEANVNKDYEGSLKIARETEQHNIADGEAHLAAWSCLVSLGRQREADEEWKLFQALLQSILKSGDGKSAKKAWFAVGIREEYLVIAALKVELEEQRSTKIDGHYFDMVLVTNESGKERVLWFNTDTDIELLVRKGDKALKNAAERR